MTVPSSQSHSTSLVHNIFLLLHNTDHGIWSVFVHLGGIRLLKIKYISGIFYDCHLHSQTDAQKGYLIFTGKLHRLNFPFYSPFAKTWRYQDTVKTLHLLFNILDGKMFGMY